MNLFKKIVKLLKENKRNIKVQLPSFWIFYENDFSGKAYTVNIYDLLINLFEESVRKSQKNVDYTQPLKNKNVEKEIIYCALVRSTVAWDFDQDGKLSFLNKLGLRETGTFLRMALLIPFLKKLGITILYLLPVTYASRRYRKGEAPCPYAPKDIYKLDPDYHDPMIGDFSEKLLELEFKALISLAHLYDIKVIIEFLPRTAARDNNIILEHPDWFYWIKKTEEKDFMPPFIPSLPNTSFFPEHTEKIYSAPDIKEFLNKFSFSPDKINKTRWNKLKNKIKKEEIDDFMPLIEKEFDITTAPGFSDCINDPQPPWVEVTFYRLFFDPPVKARKFLEKNQPPYVLFDVIKASRGKGTKPNKKLWEMLKGVLPYWQKKYGIDGARIDMGHALPEELERDILTQARKVNKSFILITEDLDNKNAAKAKKTGYDGMVGNLWAQFPRWREGNIKQTFKEELLNSPLPLMAAPEIHDTPRIITRDGKEKLHLFAIALSYFLPNTIPFFNSGIEIKEKQPMNKGLDVEFCNVSILPKKDPNYQKLALFDYTFLHWNTNSEKVINLMIYCSQLRNSFNDITEFKNCFEIKLEPENKYCFAFGYPGNFNYNYYLFLINSNLKKGFKIQFKGKKFFNFYPESLFDFHLYSKKEIFSDKKIKKKLKRKDNYYSIKLPPGQIAIIGFKKI